MKSVLAKLGSIRRRTSDSGGPIAACSAESALELENVVKRQVERLKAADEVRKAREARLTSLKPFVVDSTLVECLSYGSEHVEDKVDVFKLLTQRCGLRNIVLEAFVKEKQPDLKFLETLRSQNLINEHCFAFSELFDANGSDLPGQDLPFGLAKMIQFGIQNAILECDLAAPYINWDKCSSSEFCTLVESRCRWVAANLVAGRAVYPAAFVHLRDFATAMQVAPDRVLHLVSYLGQLDPRVRPQGILVTEPATGYFPCDAGTRVAAVRAVMVAAGWGDGQLLVRAGVGYGLAHGMVLDCLAAGASGVVAAMGGKGCVADAPADYATATTATSAATTSAAPLLDLVNLSRVGNPHVAAMYDIGSLRAAAIAVRGLMTRAAAIRRAAEAAAAAAEEDDEEAVPLGLRAVGELRQATEAGNAVQGGVRNMPSTASQRQPLILGHA